MQKMEVAGYVVGGNLIVLILLRILKFKGTTNSNSEL